MGILKLRGGGQQPYHQSNYKFRVSLYLIQQQTLGGIRAVIPRSSRRPPATASPSLASRPHPAVRPTHFGTDRTRLAFSNIDSSDAARVA